MNVHMDTCIPRNYTNTQTSKNPTQVIRQLIAHALIIKQKQNRFTLTHIHKRTHKQTDAPTR